MPDDVLQRLLPSDDLSDDDTYINIDTSEASRCDESLSTNTQVGFWHSLAMGAGAIGWDVGFDLGTSEMGQCFLAALFANILLFYFSYKASLVSESADTEALEYMSEEDVAAHVKSIALKHTLRDVFVFFLFDLIYKPMLATIVWLSQPNDTEFDFYARPDFGMMQTLVGLLFFVGGVGLFDFVFNYFFSKNNSREQLVWNAFKLGLEFFAFWESERYETMASAAVMVTLATFAIETIPSTLLICYQTRKQQRETEDKRLALYQNQGNYDLSFWRAAHLIASPVAKSHEIGSYSQRSL